jgi:hypothetical protein
MNYTILGANYANAEGTAAILATAEAGAVLASPVDTPDLWAQMLGAVGAPQPLALPAFATLKAGEFTAFRAQRQDFINRMTWVALSFSSLKTPEGDTAAANATAINNALLDLLTFPAVANATTLVALKSAMKARYKAITYPTTVGGMALPNVVAAYQKVDL